MVLLGLGGGLAFPALTMIAMADVRPSEAGLASGLLNTTGQVGGALGLAVMATLAGSRTFDLVQSGTDAITALATGYHLAWLVGAGIVAVTLAISAWLLTSRTATLANVEPDCVECEAAA